MGATRLTKTYEDSPDETAVFIGRSAISEIRGVLETLGCRRALIVCGPNVAKNREVIDPIEAALGGSLVGYTETDTRKSVRSASEGIRAMRKLKADVVIGVGGGSSLDTARQMSALADGERPLDMLAEDAIAGTLELPPASVHSTPVVVVPTTLAGADLTRGGSLELVAADRSPTGMPIRSGSKLTPAAAFYDADLIEQTPRRLLFASAMNGLDKGLETIYSIRATPLSDAVAIHGSRLFHRGLQRVAAGESDDLTETIDGLVLVQLHLRTAIIHAFGHAFSRQSDVQQGLFHAIFAPQVLDHVLGRMGERRELLADALDLDRRDADEIPARVLDAVTRLRDSMELPSRLDEVLDLGSLDFERTVDAVHDDRGMNNLHQGIRPSRDEVRELVLSAW